jgi:hypothetical protein
MESGGLFILEDINLLNTVLVKFEPVLLERNLKSYKIEIRMMKKTRKCNMYSDEKVEIKVLTF